MKTAIFHDHMDCIGGGEKLILMLAKALNADIITTDLNKETVKKIGLQGINIINIGNTIKTPPLKQISASVKFAKCDYSEKYDFFILSGAWSIFAAKKHKPNMLYCHTPVRAFYDLYDDFKKSRNPVTRPVFIMYVFLHDLFLQKHIRYVDRIVANSLNCRKRIKKCYKRDSKIIHPPIKQYKYRKNRDFWLSVNRFYPQKRIELQTEAFRNLPEEKLIIVGDYAEGDNALGYVKKITRNLPDNVKIKRKISEQELSRLYGDCKGFIATSQDEDFGMNVLEAMSAGKPVIATNEGGHKESMIRNITGKLINPSKIELVDGVKELSRNPEKYKKACQRQAGKFNSSIFIKKIKKEIKKSQGISRLR